MNIGVDIDGVIADIIPELVFRLKRLGIEACPDSWKSLYVEENYPELPEHWAKEQFADEVFLMNAVAYEQAFYCINRWFAKGNDIFLVTSRPSSMREMTERWLEEWSIQYNELFDGIEKYNKYKVLKQLNVDFMIEDNPLEAESISENGIKCYLVNRPYNSSYKTSKSVIRFDSMYNLDQKIFGDLNAYRR